MILVSDIRLGKINIRFVCEDKYIAVVGILLFKIAVDIVEIIHCFYDIRLRAENIY